MKYQSNSKPNKPVQTQPKNKLPQKTQNLQNQTGLNAEEWYEILGKIGKKAKANLCLIGSSVCMFSGMTHRISIDLDIWKPYSQFDYIELKKAVESTGLIFNPKDEFINKPYLQIVEPGIVQTGKFEKTESILTTGGLSISRPPIPNIIASKLLRAEPKDIEDIAFLINNFLPDQKEIKKAILSMPKDKIPLLKENLIYLNILKK